MVTMTKSGERSISGRKAIRRSSRGEASRCSLGGTGDDGGVGGRQQPPPCRPRAAAPPIEGGDWYPRPSAPPNAALWASSRAVSRGARAVS